MASESLTRQRNNRICVLALFFLLAIALDTIAAFAHFGFFWVMFMHSVTTVFFGVLLLLITPGSVWFYAKGLKGDVRDFIPSRYLLLTWAIILAFSLLPHLLTPEHFAGQTRRLLTAIVVLAIAPLFYINLISLGRDAAKRVLITYVIAAFVYVIFFYVTLVSGFYERPSLLRGLGTFPGFVNVRFVGFFLVPALIAGIFLWSDKMDQKISMIHLLIFGVLAVIWSLVFWAGARAGLVAAIASLLVTILLANIDRLRIFTVAISSMAIGLWGAFLYPPGAFGTGVYRIFLRLQSDNGVDAVTSGRTVLWKTGFENISTHPFIGYGIGGFFDTGKFQLEVGARNLHNVIIEMFHTGGIVAGVVFVIWLGIFYVSLGLHLRKTRDPVFIASFAAVSAFLCYAMFDGIFFHHQSFLLATLMLVLAHAMKRLSVDAVR